MFIPLFLVFIHKPSCAQTAGKIVGVVRDGSTGEPLPGANVIIDKTSLGAAADRSGQYIILRVPPGQHTIRAEFMGYQRTYVKEVEVLTDLTTHVDISMQQETLQGAEVVIIAERPLVRKDLTSSEARIQSDKIDKMPVQNVDDILDLQAGITRDVDNHLHIRGGRSSEISYMVNGISITDDFNREQALTVENESIQELQVISGTFNAEYGNAMSGVINIVTKTGSNEFNGRVEAWTGDYLSKDTDIFWNIDDFTPVSDYNLAGTVSGPFLKDRLTFFATARRLKNGGYLYGPNAYSPQGRKRMVSGQLVPVVGDSSPVAMNANERWSGQAAFEWKLLEPLTLKIDALGNTYKSHWYNHNYRLNPEGMRHSTGYGATIIAKLTHVLNKNTFYETIFSVKENKDKSYLYEDPYDSRYVHPDSLTAGSNEFFKAGTDLFRSERSTRSLIGKLDFTSQVTRNHQLKTGVEIKRDIVNFEEITLVPQRDASGIQIEPFKPFIEAVSSSNHNLFKREPDAFSAYLQDKIEYENVVINFGMRFDYFQANGHIPDDPKDPNVYNPQRLIHIYKDSNSDGVISLDEQTITNEYALEEREAFWYENSSAKTQVSPRFGIAYPITDKGVIHFSYGIFQQIPEYRQLYEGDQLKLAETQAIWGPYGNPDLNPQRTTMYELGLKQQLSDNIGVDITGYYRDIRDWISTSAPIPTYVAGVTYSKNINRDYANVKGVTVSIIKRMSKNFALDVDYTYQVVQGTNSSPEDEYDALNSGAEPKKQLAPLDWDQRHALNLNVFVGKRDLGLNILARYYSGQPYTPDFPFATQTGQNVISGLPTNLRRKPNRFMVDLYAFKSLNLYKFDTELFMRVYNLFDAKNPIDVFTDSGLPDHTIYQVQDVEADPTWFVRPDYYSAPRRVQVGVKFGF